MREIAVLLGPAPCTISRAPRRASDARGRNRPHEAHRRSPALGHVDILREGLDGAVGSDSSRCRPRRGRLGTASGNSRGPLDWPPREH